MRVFQTFILPDQQIAKYKLSFAAANFSRNLISGGMFDKVYSLIPVNVRGRLDEINEDGYEVIYSKWRLKNNLLHRFAIFAEQWRIFKKINKGDSVWFYNLNAINVLLFLLLRFFKKSVKLNVIILDFTPAKSWKEQNFWYLKCINKANGRISLSQSQLFNSKNTTVLPGVTPKRQIKYPVITNYDKTFLLSGVICENISMTRYILDAFHDMPDCTLFITGRVLESENDIIYFAQNNRNIKYLGTISSQEYLSLLHHVTFVLSTRKPDAPENDCNFPSKIIEGLLHNRIVISTIQYHQLLPLKIYHISADNISKDLRELVDLPITEIQKYANQQRATENAFNVETWNQAIYAVENISMS